MYAERGEMYYLDMQRHGKAIADHTKAIELFDGDWFDYKGVGYALRGDVYSATKQYGKAIEDYTKAIELAPNELKTEVYQLRGAVYETLGEHEKARSDYEKASEK